MFCGRGVAGLQGLSNLSVLPDPVAITAARVAELTTYGYNRHAKLQKFRHTTK